MNSELPPDLRAAIGRRLDGVSRTALAADAERLSDSYRRGKSSAVGIPGADAALAYLAEHLNSRQHRCSISAPVPEP
jgi:hypothetical protein